MNKPGPALATVLQLLHDEQRIEPGWAQLIDNQHSQDAQVSPWFVRGLIGFGAWMASLMLFIFVGVTGIVDSAAVALIFGVILLLGAVFLRRNSQHDFPIQLALSMSLTAQGLWFVGFIGIFDSLTAGLFFCIVLQAILILVYPDSLQRFLSIVVAIGAASMAMYTLKIPSAIHILVIATGIAFVCLTLHEIKLCRRWGAELIKPVIYGLLIAFLGLLLLSTLYILPELSADFVFFPHPWVSTMLLGALLFYTEFQLIGRGDLPLSNAARNTLFLFTAAIILAAWSVPGLIASFVVLLMGIAKTKRFVIAVAAGFFMIFLTAFFYGVDISFLSKSFSLILTGIVLLSARQLFLRLGVKRNL